MPPRQSPQTAAQLLNARTPLSLTLNDVTGPVISVGIAVTAIALGLGAHAVLGPSWTLPGPILIVGALLVFALLRSRPWLAGIALVAQTAVQGVLTTYFGVFGNMLTFLALGAFMLSISPKQWPRAVLGTLTQKLLGLFIMGLSISALWADPSFDTLLAMSQRLALLLVVAAVAASVSNPKRLNSLAWVTLISAGGLYLVSELGFYLGITRLDALWSGLSEASSSNGALQPAQRLYGIGGSLPINRLASFAILPSALGFGLLLSSRRPISKLIVCGLVAPIAFGVILTGSRAGTVALVVTLMVILGVVRTRRLYTIALAMGGIALTVAMLAWISPTGATSLERLVGSTEGIGSSGWLDSSGLFSERATSGVLPGEDRLTIWSSGLRMFASNPIRGTGFNSFEREFAQLNPTVRPTDAHNGFLRVLAESGLIGAVPLVALLTHILVSLSKRPPREFSTDTTWRAVVLGALLGMLTMNLMHTYMFERYLWVAVALGVALQSWRTRNAET